MLKRRFFLMVLAVVLGLFANATAGKGGKGGGGNGGGNGGGGGGGDPAPTPAGTVYFHAEGDGYYSMDADGANKTFLFAEGPGREGVQPSYSLHDGERWFLFSRQLSDLLPNGLNQRELVARNESGDEEVLWSVADVDVRPAKRWGKDGSFVSFKIADFTNDSSNVLVASIDWSTGTPVMGAATVVVEGSLLANDVSSIGGFDWDPDGNRIVFSERDHTTGIVTLFVTDLVAETTTSIGEGREPEWSADGSCIAFRDAGIWTMKPDGSDALQVSATGTLPSWSPDGTHLVYERIITKGKGKKATTASEVVRASSSGDDEVVLTNDVTPDSFPLGWR